MWFVQQSWLIWLILSVVGRVSEHRVQRMKDCKNCNMYAIKVLKVKICLQDPLKKPKGIQQIVVLLASFVKIILITHDQPKYLLA